MSCDNPLIRVFVEQSQTSKIDLTDCREVEVVSISSLTEIDLKTNDWLIVPSNGTVSIRGSRRFTNSNYKSRVKLPSDSNVVVVDPEKMTATGYKNIVAWIKKSASNQYVKPEKKEKTSPTYRKPSQPDYFVGGW